MLLALLTALGLTFGLHYYFWIRLVRDTALPQPYRGVATLALWMLGLSLPATMIFGRLSPAFGRLLAWPGFIWMGTMMLLFLTLLGSEVLRLGLSAVGLAHAATGAMSDPERRLFLSRCLAGLAGVATSGLGLVALRAGLRDVALREVEIKLRRLPAALSGLTIVQLSDVHVGPTIGRRFIETLVARVNGLDPDLIAITGDLVDGSVAELAHAVAPLGGLKARLGVFFVTGNHEYYSGVDDWLAELRRLGIRVLRNERVTVGDGEASIDLAGIDDFMSRGQAPGHGPDLPRALDGRDPSRELILLAHQPKAFGEALRHGVGLQLSGHTHGGQIWPWGYAVKLQQGGWVAGLYRRGDHQLYVNEGTGYWGPPMRLASQGGVTRLVLRRDPAA